MTFLRSHVLPAAVLCLSLAVMLAPSIAAACAVCMTGKEDDTRIAFELMTLFMTVIPFVLVGGVFWWLRGRLRDVESAHEQAREKNTLVGPSGSSPRSGGLSAVDR